MEDVNEIEQHKKLLELETVKIEAYEKLQVNRDFLVFRTSLIDEKIEYLRDLMETAKDEELPRIRGEIEALRGIITKFESTIKRKEEVYDKLKELN